MTLNGISYKNITLELSVIFVLTLSIVTCQCPRDVDRLAQDCVGHVMSQLYYQPISVSGEGEHQVYSEGERSDLVLQDVESAHRVEEACTNGDLLTFVDCLQEIHDECEHDNSESARVFRDSFNLENLVESVNFLCENSEKYVKHSVCIAEQRPDIEKCAMPEMVRFHNLTRESQNMNLQLNFQCRFMVTAFYCTSTEVRKACGREAGDIVQTLIRLSKPPACDSSIFNFSPRHHTSAATSHYVCMRCHLRCFILFLSFSSIYLANYVSIK